MARQIDPWLGVPQTAVLEENLLMVQVRMQGLDAKVRELEARLVQVAQAANEAGSDADRANGQTLKLEAQLADIAGALLMVADQLAVTGDEAGFGGRRLEPRRPQGPATLERRHLSVLNDAT